MGAEGDTDVIIVGAGPVGLTAAIDLGTRGIPVTVVEERAFLAPPSVKCNHVAARTMERFRRLGLADAVRQAGLPADYPQSVAFRTRLTGIEFGRIPIPAARDRYTSTTGPDTSWATPEPPHRINQTFLNPILERRAADLDTVTLLNDTRFQRYTQTDDGVRAVVTDRDDGNERVLTGAYLLGADGSRSRVRKQLGATFHGDPVLQRVQSTCIRAPRLYDRMPGERAWGYYAFNPDRTGHVYAIDGHEVFLVHNYLGPHEGDGGGVDRDAAIRAILGVDDDFAFDVLSEEDWTARRLVADRFRDGRVFLAGDACHLWVPYAGFGMNAGIADALNLTWLLAARLGGWAADGVLDAYEAERLPITEQVSRFAMDHQQKLARPAVPADIEADTAVGRRERAQLGEQAYAVNVQQFAAAGLNFGYAYDRSPIIAYDGEEAPAYTMGSYTPSTVPGCRAPHFWLADGRSLYDAFGPGYTLICLDDPEAMRGLGDAAARAGLPLQWIVVEPGRAPAEYTHPYVICREDQHVAWRGTTAPADAAALVQHLRGAARPSTR